LAPHPVQQDESLCRESALAVHEEPATAALFCRKNRGSEDVGQILDKGFASDYVSSCFSLRLYQGSSLMKRTAFLTTSLFGLLVAPHIAEAGFVNLTSNVPSIELVEDGSPHTGTFIFTITNNLTQNDQNNFAQSRTIFSVNPSLLALTMVGDGDMTDKPVDIKIRFQAGQSAPFPSIDYGHAKAFFVFFVVDAEMDLPQDSGLWKLDVLVGFSYEDVNNPGQFLGDTTKASVMIKIRDVAEPSGVISLGVGLVVASTSTLLRRKKRSRGESFVAGEKSS
jgi:hypothetical protein